MAGVERIWFSHLPAGILASLWGITLSALVFAVADWFIWWLVIPIGLSLALMVHRFLPRRQNGIASGFWLAAIAMALASAVSGGLFPAEHLLTGRDAGTYAATAAWLGENRELPVDAELGGFAGADDLEFVVPGFYKVNGALGPQFLHAFPALMGLVDQLTGMGPAIRLNALLGTLALLVVFAFAALLMRPVFALLVEAALGVNLVFVYYTKAPFSEVLTLVFVFGGLWALWGADKSLPRGLLAGLILGGAILARIDSLVLLVPLVAIAVLTRWRSPSTKGALLGMGIMAVVAAVDVSVVDPFYVGLLRMQILAILLAVAAVIAAGVVLGPRLARIGGALRSHGPVFAGLTGGLVGALALFAYFVRPHLGQATGSPYGLDAIQQAQDLPVEPLRTYAEWSAHWLGWYIGPILAVAAIGWALMPAHVMTRREYRTIPFLAVFSTFTVLYVWQPSINPDHIWAMRRFLPVVIPGLLICAGWALDRLLDARQIPTWASRSLVGLLALLMVAAPLRTAMPLAQAHEFDGLVSDFERACSALGDSAAVLVLDYPDAEIGPRLVQGFRSFCDLPAAYAEGPLPASRISELSHGWAAENRTLWVVSGHATERGVILFDQTYQRVELTLTRPPSMMTPFPLRVWAEETE